MAYQTGTALNADDLLDKIRGFAVAQGWTQNEWAAISGGHRLCLQKSLGTTFHLALKSTATSILMRGATGFTAGVDLSAQPGAMGWDAGCDRLGAGAFPAYYLFSDTAGSYVHCVVEHTAGIFKHLVFGELERFGSYAGGHYCDGVSFSDLSGAHQSANNTAHQYLFGDGRVNAGASTNFGAVALAADGQHWRRLANPDFDSTLNAMGCCRAGLYGDLVPAAQPNFYNLAMPLLPIYVLTERVTGTVGDLAPLGLPRDLRFCWIEHYSPGQEITLGPDTWKLFPVARRTAVQSASDGLDNSWYYGYAYRKIV